MSNNNLDISQLMNTLSKMDKKDLEKGINQLNTILKSNNQQKIIDQLKNNMNQKRKLKTKVRRYINGWRYE